MFWRRFNHRLRALRTTNPRSRAVDRYRRGDARRPIPQCTCCNCAYLLAVAQLYFYVLPTATVASPGILIDHCDTLTVPALSVYHQFNAATFRNLYPTSSPTPHSPRLHRPIRLYQDLGQCVGGMVYRDRGGSRLPWNGAGGCCVLFGV